ncbi:MAG: FG-GAP repeat protein [Deltaproteobacteria bacterium]|nr:FG-GAP repeat protein [Deltaproteobacteria bacterium]
MKLSKVLWIFGLLSLLGSSACDCDGDAENPCDCEPTITFLSPTGGALTEFNDTNETEEGIQYPVRIQLRCVPDGTSLTFTNSLSPGETVRRDVSDGDGDGESSIEYGELTFLDGVNRICVTGSVEVAWMEDGSLGCSTRSVPELEICKDVTVQLGVPACRFENPEDGSTLTQADDDDPIAAGFQQDVAVVCKGVDDGQDVELSINARPPITGVLAFSRVDFDSVDLAEGADLLHLETQGQGGESVIAEIGVTVDTGGCAVRLTPMGGVTFRAADDEEPGVEGLQISLTVSTDPVGAFACADGSAVRVIVDGQEFQGVLSDGTAIVLATLPDGEIEAFAEVEEAGGRTGRSLVNRYFVCASPVEVSILSPRDDPDHSTPITDAADRDPAPGIQIAVRGNTSGVPDAERMWLKLDERIVMDGLDPLRPVAFQPGGEYEFRYLSFLQPGEHVVSVEGEDACGERAAISSTVWVVTAQVTCQVVDPADGSTLLAADDKDGDPDNDLQYDVGVLTANVSGGGTFEILVDGTTFGPFPVDTDTQSGMGEVRFVDGQGISVQCLLSSGEASPTNRIDVDGHPPTIEITDPAGGATFQDPAQAVCVETTGVENGQLVTVLVEQGASSDSVSASITGNQVCIGNVPWFSGANTVTASVSDAAGNPAESTPLDVTYQSCTAEPQITFINPDPTPPVEISNAGPYTVEVDVTEVLDAHDVELVIVTNGVPAQPVTPNRFGGGRAEFDVVLANGSIQFQVSATNFCGTGQEQLDALVGDPNLPSIAISSPADGDCSQTSTVSVSAQTTNADSRVCLFCFRPRSADAIPECSLATPGFWTTGAVDGAGVCSSQIDAQFPSEGDFQIWASVSNDHGSSTSPAVGYRIDATPPTVSIDEPSAGAVFNASSPDAVPGGELQIRVVVSADVRDGLTAELTGHDGIGDSPMPVFSGGQITFQRVTVTDGDHSLEAQVTDCAGNTGASIPVQITVDRIEPEVIALVPADGSAFSVAGDQGLGTPGFQRNVTCQFAAGSIQQGDALSLTRQIQGVDPTPVEVASASLNAGETSRSLGLVTLLPPPHSHGNLRLVCSVTDAAGNAGSIYSDIRIDLDAPEVDITRPTDGAQLNRSWDMCAPAGFQTQVNVSVTNIEAGDTLYLCVCDPSGPSSCSNDDAGACGDAGYGRTVTPGSVGGPGTVTLNCVDMPQGDVRLRAYAENIPGQGQWSAPVAVYVDSLPPTVATRTILTGNGDDCLNQSEGGLHVRLTVDDQGNSLDGRTVRLYEDWPPGTALPGASGTVAGATVDLSASLVSGVHVLTAVFSDALGNPNMSTSPPITDPNATFTVTVDTAAPVISISSPNKTLLNLSDDLISGGDLDFNFCVSCSGVEDGQVVTFLPMNATAAVADGAACVQTSIPEGDTLLEVQVRDACGNPEPGWATDQLAVRADLTPPTISCNPPPAQDAYYTDTSVHFICQTTGTDSTQRIQVVSTQGGPRCSPYVDGSGTTDFYCNLQPGVQDLDVTVTDPAGNVSAPWQSTNLEVDIAGCDLDVLGYLPVEIFNAADDKDADPSNGLQIDVQACSSTCTGSDVPTPVVRLRVSGGLVQTKDLGADGTPECVTFFDVRLDDGAAGVDVEAEIDDGGGHLFPDGFQVEMVDLLPPTLERLAPGEDDVLCVASQGNPSANGVDILADLSTGAPCNMAFGFRVTDGGDPTYPGSLSLREGADTRAGPTSITGVPSQNVNWPNVALTHNASHALQAVATDYAGNPSVIDLSVIADVVAPGTVNASAALEDELVDPAASRHADVLVSWSAVGDDGADGTPAGYEVRYATAPISSEARWQTAVPVYSGPSTSPPVFEGWPPLNTYSIAVRAVDEVGNYGAIPSLSLANYWRTHTVVAPGEGGYFAYGLWSIGDVDHDGYADLAVGAHTELTGGGGTDGGAVYVFYGQDDLSAWSAGQRLSNDTASEKFGSDVGRIGDISGPETCAGDDQARIDDLVVSGRGYGSGQGRVSIYFGRCLASLPAAPDIEIRGNVAGDLFGYYSEMIGDVDGDGIDDLLVSAPTASAAGNAYLFFGRSQADWVADSGGDRVLSASDADVVIVGRDAEDWFGYASGISTLGDLDGDGMSEFIVGASSVNDAFLFDGQTIYLETQTGDGTAYAAADNLAIFHEGPSGMYSGCDPYYFCVGFGNRAVGNADFDHDGLPDLAVAAAYFEKVYLYPGVAGGVDDVAFKTINSTEGSVWLGWELVVEDVNMDGWQDIALGTNTSNGHKAIFYLNRGSAPEYFGNSPDIVLSEDSEYYGISIAVDDFDSDGLPDVIIGSNIAVDAGGGDMRDGMFYLHY